jgi:hypothetical protein
VTVHTVVDPVFCTCYSFDAEEVRSALDLLEFRTIDHAMQPVCNFIAFLAGFSFCPLYGFHNIMSLFWYLCGVCFSLWWLFPYLCGVCFSLWWLFPLNFRELLWSSCHFSLDMSMGRNKETPGFFWAKIT